MLKNNSTQSVLQTEKRLCHFFLTFRALRGFFVWKKITYVAFSVLALNKITGVHMPWCFAQGLPIFPNSGTVHICSIKIFLQRHYIFACVCVCKSCASLCRLYRKQLPPFQLPLQVHKTFCSRPDVASTEENKALKNKASKALALTQVVIQRFNTHSQRGLRTTADQSLGQFSSCVLTPLLYDLLRSQRTFGMATQAVCPQEKHSLQIDGK